jgi:exopolysaccharide production protein ExoQ
LPYGDIYLSCLSGLPRFMLANRHHLHPDTTLLGLLGGRGSLSAEQRWLSERLLDLLIIASLVIHTGAPVAILTKLAGSGQSPISAYIWLLGALIGFALFVATPVRATLVGLRILPFVLLTGWVFATYFWSMSPFDTFRGAIYLAASHLTAVVMAARLEWRRILLLVTCALGLTVVPGALLAIAVPSFGRMSEIHVGAWSGVWMEKQTMGFFSCQLMIAAATLFVADRKLWPALLFIPIGMLGVWGATGRSAMIISALALISIPVVLYYNGGRRRAVFMPWLALVAAGLLAIAISGGTANLLKLLGRSGDLTGRVEIWHEVKTLIISHSDTGYGYQAVWQMRDAMTSPYQWIAAGTGFTPANAHSSWLDAQLGLGLPGLILLIACMIFVWGLTIFSLRANKAAAAYSFATLLCVTVLSFTESILLNPMDLQWLLVVLIAAKLLSPDPVPLEAGLTQPAPKTGHDSLGYFEKGGFTYSQQKARS